MDMLTPTLGPAPRMRNTAFARGGLASRHSGQKIFDASFQLRWIVRPVAIDLPGLARERHIVSGRPGVDCAMGFAQPLVRTDVQRGCDLAGRRFNGKYFSCGNERMT